MATDNPRPPGDKELVVRGIAWTSGYRVFASLAQFGAMLVLVRIIPPAEYGRAGAIVGLLTLVNIFSCGVFINQALQLRDGEEPNWSLHWRAGFWLQAVLFVVTNALATALWFSPDHRSIAPLMHLASLGLLFEGASSLRGAMLRRAMAFRRIRILDGIGKLASILVMLSLGVAGWGAFAIVLGANVVPAVPGAVDLLLVKRWRPDAGWFRFPDWREYKPAIKFGLQQSGSGLLHALRGALEAFVFPGRLGFVSLGLLQRAQALFGSTVGQANGIFAETVYPLLPRHASNRARYSKIATRFLQVVCMVVIPGAVFVGWQGKALLRLLYGQKWIAADPLILPAVLIGAGLCLFASGYKVLLAKTELRRCFALDIAGALLTAPMILIVVLGGDTVVYAWALAAGQLSAAAVAIAVAAPLFEPRWVRAVFLPPVSSAAIAFLSVHFVFELDRLPLGAAVVVRAMLFAVIAALTVRLLFPDVMTLAMRGVPGGERLSKWLRLPPEMVVEP